MDVYKGLEMEFPECYADPQKQIVIEDSGKLAVLIQMLHQFHNEGHKVVLVSHYTMVRFFN